MAEHVGGGCRVLPTRPTLTGLGLKAMRFRAAEGYWHVLERRENRHKVC